MPISIAQERPDTPDAMALIEELDTFLRPLSPSEHRFGMSVASLLDQGVDFFVVREDGAAVGCGGVLCVGNEYGEVKRMYVRPAYRGRAIGALILSHLEQFVLARGITVLRLEMGIAQPAAKRLYERYGFSPCPPFGSYQASEWNRFYEKRLSPA